MSEKEDLGILINKAEEQLKTGIEEGDRIQLRRKHIKSNGALILPLVLFVLAFYIYINNKTEMPGNVAISNELISLVTEARRLVDANTVDGIFPPVLPNAALGAIVRYEVVGNSYVISASMNGVFVEINKAGELVVTGVVR